VVTEVMIWALILTNRKNDVVEIYHSELLCRQEMLEVRKAVPQAKFKCVPRHSLNRPAWDSAGRASGAAKWRDQSLAADVVRYRAG
jgi:hypothetical protein